MYIVINQFVFKMVTECHLYMVGIESLNTT
jgi:hypothetical protein